MDGWNGDGSLAPTPDVFDNCGSLLPLVPYNASVTPDENGTIMFEWYDLAGFWMLEVGKDKFSLITPTAFINASIRQKQESVDVVPDIAERP